MCSCTSEGTLRGSGGSRRGVADELGLGEKSKSSKSARIEFGPLPLDSYYK